MRIRSLAILAIYFVTAACSTFSGDEDDRTWMEVRRDEVMDEGAKSPDHIPQQTFSPAEQAEMQAQQQEVLRKREQTRARLDALELEQDDTESYVRQARERAQAPDLPQ